MVKHRWLLIAILSAYSLPGHGATSEPRLAPQWRATAARVLAERGDANSLATAALLGAAGGPELAAQASELEPDDAALAWIRLRLCATAAGCDIRDAATAMRWIDADNSAAWLPTLAGAVRDKDDVEIERVLTDMAQGKRFDVYYNRASVLMFDALKAAARGLPHQFADSDSGRLSLATAMAAAKLVPSFTAIAEACRDSAALAERREICLKVAKRMQQSDTVGGQLAGLALEKRLLPGDSREARALGERRRVLEWRVSAAAKFDEPLLPWLKNSHARWRVSRMRNLRREEDVLVATLRERGVAINPP